MTDSMSPSEMLSAYMDGELDEQSTSMLFYHMANDVDLQQEMQQLMAIRTATSSSTVQVPAHLKHTVFAETIGIDDKVAASGLGGFATAGLMMGAAAIASIATAWFLMSDSKPVMNDTRLAATIGTTSQEKPVLSTPHTEHLTTFSGIDKQQEIPAKNVTTNVHIDNLPDDAENNVIINHDNSTVSAVSNEQNVPHNLLEQEIQQEDVHTIIASEYRPVSTLYSMQRSGTTPRVAQMTFRTNDDEPPLVEFSVRGLVSSSLQTSSLAVPSQPFYSNMGVGVFYRMGESDKIGIEAGYDRWTQTFEGKEGDTSVKFEQIYNAPWVGIAYRHSMNPVEWLSNASPYIQGGLGATAVGPVARIALGVEYPLFQRVTLSAGMEASGLAYQYQSAIFASQRIAFVSMIHIGL